jgi:hypothetical protein
MGRAHSATTASDSFSAVFGTRRGSEREDVRYVPHPQPHYLPRPHMYIVDDNEAWRENPSFVGFVGNQQPNSAQYFFSPQVGDRIELLLAELEAEFKDSWERKDINLIRRCLKDLPTPIEVVVTAPEGSDYIMRLADGRDALVISDKHTVGVELECSDGNKQVFNCGVTALKLLTAPRGRIYNTLYRDLPQPLAADARLYKLPRREYKRALSKKLLAEIELIKDNDEEMLEMMRTTMASGGKVWYQVHGVMQENTRHHVENSTGRHYGVDGEAIVETSFQAEGAPVDEIYPFYLHARDVLSPLSWDREIGGNPRAFL